MNYYGPDGRTFGSLAEAIDSGGGFAVMTSDARYATFVDWRELDEDDRRELRELSSEDEETVELSMMQALFTDLPESERRLLLADVTETVLNWTVAT